MIKHIAPTAAFALLSALAPGCGGGSPTLAAPQKAELVVEEPMLAVEAVSVGKVDDLRALAAAQGWNAVVADANHQNSRGRRLLRFTRLAAGVPADQLVDLLDRDPRALNTGRNERHCLDTKVGGSQSQVAIFDDGLSFSSVMGQPAMARAGVAPSAGGPTGQGVVVAVLDGGFRLDHEALAGRLAGPGYDAIDFDADPTDRGNGRDDDRDGRVDEGVGHGTAVAAVVLAVAPGARILPVRVLDDEGNGTALSLALGILHACAAGAIVINISACADVESKLVQDVLREATQQYRLVVACTGNGARPTVSFPASSRYVLAVAGIDNAGAADPTTNYGAEVGLAAPSMDVIAPHPLGPTAYGRWRGTSLAAPFVAGAAALVMDDDVTLNPDVAGQRLCVTAAPYSSLPDYLQGRMGRGVLDVTAALR